MPDDEHKDRLVNSKYRFASTRVLMNLYLSDIERLSKEGWHFSYNDLRAPDNNKDRENLFAEMGLPTCMSYNDFARMY